MLGVTYHSHMMPTDGTQGGDVKPLRYTVQAKSVSTPIDSVRVHEYFGANHASQLIDPLWKVFF
jgi:hypothetical protein